MVALLHQTATGRNELSGPNLAACQEKSFQYRCGSETLPGNFHLTGLPDQTQIAENCKQGMGRIAAVVSAKQLPDISLSRRNVGKSGQYPLSSVLPLAGADRHPVQSTAGPAVFMPAPLIRYNERIVRSIVRFIADQQLSPD